MITLINLTKKYKPLAPKCRGLFAKSALENITLSINKGECVGIIGKNGSGKSTLLKLICGITAKTSGKISVNGSISALLELGAGFNAEYTGISNIYLNGTIMGKSKSEITALIPEIKEFADIGNYIEMPVKTYSDGMFLRLAFATAIAMKSDILIVDEALAVGDFAFRQKCFNKINELKNSGTTVLMVSHDIDTIRRFCSRVIWIDDGKLRLEGETAYVTSKYMESITGAAPLQNGTEISQNGRFGSAVGSILSAKIPEVMATGEKTELFFDVNIPENVKLDSLAFSVSVKNVFGLDLTVISTADSGYKFTKTGKTCIKLQFNCLLCSGEYSISAALEDRSTIPIKYYDYIENIKTFRVHSSYLGTFYTETEFQIN